MPSTGYQRESWKFTDHSHEAIFGAAPAQADLTPFEHDISGLPVIYQGSVNSCVSCAVTFVRNWQAKQEGKPVSLSWPFLAKISDTGPNGARPSQVLSPAHKVGICKVETFGKGSVQEELEAAGFTVQSYSFLTDYSPAGIVAALKRGLLAVGVKNFQNVGPHFLVAYGISPEGKLKLVNWWTADKQSLAEIDFADVDVAVSFASRPESVPGPISIPAWTVLADKFLMNWKKIAAVVFAGTTAVGGAYGAGYIPVTDYSTNTTQYVSASATTIPVASTLDKAGNQISFSNISASTTPYAFFTLEPGTSREEIIACSSVTASQWGGCIRGMPFQGGTLTSSSSLQFAHNAGSRLIMSNVGQFFSEFVSISGNQTIFDTKTFNTFPAVTSTTGIPSAAAELATKYYVDQVGAGGMTASNIDTQYGLVPAGTVPEKVRINLSSTSSGMYFDSNWTNYPLTVQVSSTGGLVVNGSGRLVVDTSDALTWTATETFTPTMVATGGITLGILPSGSTSATSKGYVDNQIMFGQATGTAQVAITAGQALWVSATSSQIMLTNSSVASSTYQFIGIAASTVSAGAVVTYTKPGSVNCFQSGLTSGLAYYLSGTAGQIATTPGTLLAKIGRAVSTTCVQVEAPKFVVHGTISVPASTNPIYTNLGFYPAHISMVTVGNAGSGGLSLGDDSNNEVHETGTAGTFVTSTKAWTVINLTPTTLGIGTVSSKDAYGFTITPTTAVGTLTIQYTAFSE